MTIHNVGYCRTLQYGLYYNLSELADIKCQTIDLGFDGEELVIAIGHGEFSVRVTHEDMRGALNALFGIIAPGEPAVDAFSVGTAGSAGAYLRDAHARATTLYGYGCEVWLSLGDPYVRATVGGETLGPA